MALALLPFAPMRMLSLAATVAILLASSGCVALPALAPAALSAGGDVIKEGTVRMGGATYRTFSLPLADVYQATRTTLDSLGFPKPDEEMVEERVTLRAHAVDRTVRIDLQPITGSMTQMRVFVRKQSLFKDLATASELVAQTEQTLAPRLESRAARGHLNGRQSRR